MTATSAAPLRNQSNPWLTDLPGHWKWATLRRIARRYAGGTPDRENDLYWDDGSIPWVNSGVVNQRTVTVPSAFITPEGYRASSAKWVPRGALVMALAGQGSTKGRVAQMAIEATCNQSLAAIVPNASVDARFLYWWLTSKYEEIRGLAGTEQRDGLNLEMLGSIPCPLPPLDEQRTLAAHLDACASRIDALIARRRALVNRLREKRRALVSQVVARGLPPEAARAAGFDTRPEFKSTGIQWLGDVPLHWSVVPLRYLAKRIATGSTPPTAEESYYEDGTLPWFGPSSFGDGFEPGPPVKLLHYSAVADGVARLVPPAAAMVVTIGATLGKVAAAPCECSCNQQITFVVFDQRRVRPMFGMLQLRRLEPLLRGIAPSATLPILSNAELRALRLAVPPLPEQDAILEYLARESSRLDQLAEKVEAAIRRLHEYRSALISAAVTGNIDVRNAGSRSRLAEAVA